MQVTFEVKDKDSKEVREAVDKLNIDSEVEKLNAVCFWLIKMCVDTNATSAKVAQENVNVFGKPLGNWEISVKKATK